MCESGWDTHCPPPAFSPVRGGEGAQLDWGLLHRGRTVKLGFVAFNDDWGLHLLKGPILHPCIDLCFSSRIPLRKLVTVDYLHVIFSPLFAASRLLASKLVPCWTFYVFGRRQKRGGLRGRSQHLPWRQRGQSIILERYWGPLWHHHKLMSLWGI